MTDVSWKRGLQNIGQEDKRTAEGTVQKGRRMLGSRTAEYLIRGLQNKAAEFSTGRMGEFLNSLTTKY